MTLIDHLKNVAEHKDEFIFEGEEFPFFMANRFFSFVSNPQCKVINELTNYSHWNEVDSDFKLKLLQSIVPKTRFNYNTLFSGYVKRPKMAPTPKNDKKIEYLSKVYEIPKSEAEVYLKLPGVGEYLDGIEL